MILMQVSMQIAADIRLYGKIRVDNCPRFYGMSTQINQIHICFFLIFLLKNLSINHKMINSGQCLIDPSGLQPTLSLDRPPEEEDGGIRPGPEMPNSSGQVDSCQLETVNTK